MASIEVVSAVVARRQQLHLAAPSLAQLISTVDLTAQAPTAGREEGPAKQLREQLTTLLTDSAAVSDRWAGLVLVQALIKSSGWASVEPSPGWVRKLVNILQKPNPWCSRVIAIATLSAVFRLSSGRSQFVRETITPILPLFIRLCIGFLRQFADSNDRGPTVPCVAAVLAVFTDLLPGHPAVFRPFCADINVAVRILVFATGSTSASPVPASIRDGGMVLIAELSRCAPRTEASDTWARQVTETVAAGHRALDHLLRPLPLDPEGPDSLSSEARARIIEPAGPADSTSVGGLPGWVGASEGTARVSRLLLLLSAYLSSSTAAAVSIPIGAINSLLSRILDLSPPTSPSHSGLSHLPANSSVSRTEAADLFAFHVPVLHTAALRTAAVVADRLGQAAGPVVVHLLRIVPAIFTSSQPVQPAVRTAAYDFLATALEAVGPSVSTSLTVPSGRGIPPTSVLRPVVEACTTDLLASFTAKLSQTMPVSSNPLMGLPSLSTSSSTVLKASPAGSVIEAGKRLLPLLYSIPAADLPAGTRTLLDRSTVLLQINSAFLASALFPAAARHVSIQASASTIRSTVPSILSMAPRPTHSASNLPLDGLVRPRFPAVRSSSQAVWSTVDPSSEHLDEPVSKSEPPKQTLSDDRRKRVRETMRQLERLLDGSEEEDTQDNDCDRRLKRPVLDRHYVESEDLNRSFQSDTSSNLDSGAIPERTMIPIIYSNATSHSIEAESSDRSDDDNEQDVDMHPRTSLPPLVSATLPTFAASLTASRTASGLADVTTLDDADGDDNDEFDIPDLIIGSESE